MPGGYHVLKECQGGILVPVLARNPKPALPGFAVAGAVVVGMDIEQRRKLDSTGFEIVGMNVDHQGDPIPLACFFSHHGKHKPAGRQTIEKFELHDCTAAILSRLHRRDLIEGGAQRREEDVDGVVAAAFHDQGVDFDAPAGLTLHDMSDQIGGAANRPWHSAD
jgi:hypothetical protein